MSHTLQDKLEYSCFTTKLIKSYPLPCRKGKEGLHTDDAELLAQSQEGFCELRINMPTIVMIVILEELIIKEK